MLSVAFLGYSDKAIDNSDMELHREKYDVRRRAALRLPFSRPERGGIGITRSRHLTSRT